MLKIVTYLVRVFGNPSTADDGFDKDLEPADDRNLPAQQAVPANRTPLRGLVPDFILSGRSISGQADTPQDLICHDRTGILASDPDVAIQKPHG